MSIQTINRILAGLLSAAVLVTVARAQETPKVLEIDENDEVIRLGNEVPDECAFPNLELPEEFVVYAAGGDRNPELDFQIDQSGYMASQMNLVVNSPSEPVVLMLGSHDPTIYNIQWTEDTEIVAVLTSGYDRCCGSGIARRDSYLEYYFF